MGRYIIMNKDKKVALVDIEGESIKILEQYMELPSYIKDKDRWLSSRMNLYSRRNILDMAKIANINSKEDFVNIAKAISVIDTLWVNNLDSKLKWDKVSPYRNRISLVMANLAIDGFSPNCNINMHSPSPQYRVDGMTDKCVKRVNGKLILYKTAGEKWSDLAGCRPYSEYYASYVANKIGIKRFVRYNIKEKITENRKIKPYSVCELFTDENNGLMQMGNTKFSEIGIDELANKVNKEMKQTLREMAIIDSIILNRDRHQGNYGFIVNNDTFKIKGMAPIYDNDCSLGSLTSLQYKTIEESYLETKSKAPLLGLGHYDDMAKWGMTRDMLNRLKSVGYIKLERKFKGLSEKRMKFMEYIVNRRIKEILDMFE